MPRTGIILAGGRSRRMGRDKASLMVNGRSLLSRVIARVCEVEDLSELIVSHAEDQILPTDIQCEISLKTAVDVVQGEGPLIGIASALIQSTSTTNLIVGADMPLVQPRLLNKLAEVLEETNPFAQESLPLWVIPKSDHIQPLCSAISSKSLSIIKEAIQDSVRAPGQLIESLNAIVLDEKQWTATDPDRMSFRDIDTPADLESSGLV